MELQNSSANVTKSASQGKPRNDPTQRTGRTWDRSRSRSRDRRERQRHGKSSKKRRRRRHRSTTSEDSASSSESASDSDDDSGSEFNEEDGSFGGGRKGRKRRKGNFGESGAHWGKRRKTVEPGHAEPEGGGPFQSGSGINAQAPGRSGIENLQHPLTQSGLAALLNSLTNTPHQPQSQTEPNPASALQQFLSNPSTAVHLSAALQGQSDASNRPGLSSQSLSLSGSLPMQPFYGSGAASSDRNGTGAPDAEFVRKISMFIDPLRLEIYNLSRRIDALETARFANMSEIGSVRASLSDMQDKLSSLTSLGPSEPSPSSKEPHPASANKAVATGRKHYDGTTSKISDAFAEPAIPSASVFRERPPIRHVSSRAEDFENPHDIASFGLRSEARSRLTSSVPPDSSGPTAETPQPQPQPPSSSSNAKSKRKPALSRAVRTTIFKMLGLASPDQKYHGYISSPSLPDFQAGVIIDQETGERVWRWDWSKTLRQSSDNSKFAAEVRKRVLEERSTLKAWLDVPDADWEDIDNAIDSAYTNLRRERDAQLDPKKGEKKEVHRRRNKKRGLKEEKSRRRKKAFEELRKGLNSTTDPFKHFAEAVGGGGDADVGRVEAILESALDLNYMSSEEENEVATKVGRKVGGGKGGATEGREGNDEGLAGDISSYVHGHAATSVSLSPTSNLTIAIDPSISQAQPKSSSSNTAASNESTVAAASNPSTPAIVQKTFSVHAPSWRSDTLTKFYNTLDKIKVPERAYKRVQGDDRDVCPPARTLEWMVREEWRDKIGKDDGDEDSDGLGLGLGAGSAGKKAGKARKGRSVRGKEREMSIAE